MYNACTTFNQEIPMWEIPEISPLIESAFKNFTKGYGVSPNNPDIMLVLMWHGQKGIDKLSDIIHEAGYRFENGKGWLNPDGTELPFVKYIKNTEQSLMPLSNIQKAIRTIKNLIPFKKIIKRILVCL